MKRLVIGILAHVDSGKTTLSEGMLYSSGDIRKLGRVDHKTSFLDTYSLEKERGITIFSKQAVLHLDDAEITLLDTPGHIDFSAETERTLQVLDYAVLVINGSDGVQNHTRTLWKLLERYNVPVFVFINKMDLPGTDREVLLTEMKLKLSDCCCDFDIDNTSDEFYEETASHDEKLMQEFFDNNKVSHEGIIRCIRERKIFPCFFGSALKLDGVENFLKKLNEYTVQDELKEDFSAKVFKISEDDQGNRLSYIKITGGRLKVKEQISNQKINHIRVYSGTKFQAVETAVQGMVAAVTGLADSYPGQGLGSENDSPAALLEPVLTYKAQLSPEINIHEAVSAFRRLEAEEPKLHVIWNEQLKEIHIQVMGEMQLDIVKALMMERFHMEVEFVHGNVAYKETIAEAVEGVGHYEPLRHYAEVHLLLEPGEQGSGLVFETDCREEILDKNWQRLVMTHLNEKTHNGVLTGSPVTDMKITLVSGRAHLKHTEGGDFRQATYRAVRNGLRHAQSILLEPYYDYILEIPSEYVGRAISDLTRMDCSFSAPEVNGDISVITGTGPVAAVKDYHTELMGYTKGKGIFTCTPAGYKPCHNSEEVIEQMNYNCDSDVENSCDSVFCSHGAGFVVKWNEVGEYMHLPGLPGLNYGKQTEKHEDDKSSSAGKTVSEFRKSVDSEKELMAIFEMAYGKQDNNEHKKSFKSKKDRERLQVTYKSRPIPKGPEYLLVDGYNIIFSWRELKDISTSNLDLARSMLINTMCNYQGVYGCEVIIVFDAYKVKGSVREVEKVGNISVIYTKESETADMYIEKASHDLSRKHRVRVATSDGMEQLIILGNGAFRISAAELYEEVKIADKRIQDYIRENTK
ncbi:MAG: TetM/TetW/TetO/TetS family tetracycline resistance ribosomal protection protein [Oscillospiraceae bacterium]|nr:TetM/TetW/TetO/TetS family tetracycline resistance ribosomal protection protein [Oscillospiraceae bacterium]